MACTRLGFDSARDGTATPPRDGATDGLSADGAHDGPARWDGREAGACTGPTTVVLAPLDDTRLDSSWPNHNYGRDGTLQIHFNSPMLFRFDPAGLPGDTAVDTATLELYSELRLPEQNAPIWLTLYEVLTGNSLWREGSRRDQPGGAGDATWSFLDEGRRRPWAGAAGLFLPGIDYRLAGESDVSGFIQADTVYRWRLRPALVESWRGSGAPNAGLILRTATGFHFWFSAKEHAVAAQRPRLVLTLRCR